MRDEELLSPPYPGDGTTTQLIYQRLKELREWANKYLDEINELAGQEQIPPVKKFPRYEVYASQPILIQFEHFVILRQIRESWDELIRDHEDSWDCRQALRRRAMLVSTAAFTLNEAFIPFEVREANTERKLEKLQKRFKHLRTYLNQVIDTVEDTDQSDGGG